MTTFVEELSSFCHGDSGAWASAICHFRRADNGANNGSKDVVFEWLKTTGKDAEFFKGVVDPKPLSAFAREAISKSLEQRYFFDRSTNRLIEFPKVASSRKSSPAAAEAQANNASSTGGAAIATAPPLAMAKVKISVPGEDVIWIRPLTSTHAIISIIELPDPSKPPGAQTKQVRKPNERYMSFIRNAHQLRELRIVAMAKKGQTEIGAVAEADTEVEAGPEAEANTEADNALIHNQMMFAQGISKSLPLRELGYQLANDLKNYLQCDRVVALDINGQSATPLAFSSQPKFDPRSNSVRATQTMVGNIAAIGEPFWFTGDSDDLPDSLKSTIQRYTNETLVNSFAVFPIVETTAPTYPSEDESMQEAISPGSCSQTKTVGAILVEQIEDIIDQEKIEARWDPIKQLVENQYINSRRYDSVFLVGLWDRLGRFAAFYRGQTQKKAVLITSAIAFCLLSLFLIPTDFKIRCEGYLVIDGTREFYSMGDGPITDLRVKDGQQVEADEVLLVQEDSELKMRLIKLDGKVSQLQSEVDAINDQRIRDKYIGSTKEDDNKSEDLIQQVSVKEIELSSLRRERTSALREFDRLTIRAPYAGTIAQWKMQQRLSNRPLDKGTHLFSLIPHDANVRLDLRVPDQRAGYIQKAWKDSKEQDKELELDFRLSSAPGVEQQAQVVFVSPSLEKDRDIGYSLLVHAIAEEEISSELIRSKTVVLGKIICGRHSIAYCKSYEALDWLNSKLFELWH